MHSEWLTDALSEPANRLGANSGTEVGAEHEYVVANRDGQVDYREIILTTNVEGKRLDPGDKWAYRCATGTVLTCDGPEAEVVTPPIPVSGGFASKVDEVSQVAFSVLRMSLPEMLTTKGYSTHLNVSVNSGKVDRAASQYPATFGVGLLAITGRQGTPGIQVRPRHGRIELVSSHCDGQRLRAAAAYAVGSVLALERGDPLPPILDVVVDPCVIRYGLYLDRLGAGVDVLKGGRSSRLRSGGRTIILQEQLEAAWECARNALGEVSDSTDLAAADAIVAGAEPIGCELDSEPFDSTVEACALGGTYPGRVSSTPLHDLLLTRRRPGGIVVEAVRATWDYAVFRAVIPQRSREVFLSLPRRFIDPFLSQLDDGQLDDRLHAELMAPSKSRHLGTFTQTTAPRIFDSIGGGTALLAPDRDPGGAPVSGFAPDGAVINVDRPGKSAPPDQIPPTTVDIPEARKPVWPWVLAALILATAAFWLWPGTGSGGGGQDEAPEHFYAQPYDVGPLAVTRDPNGTITNYALQFVMLPGDAVTTWNFDGPCGSISYTSYMARVDWSKDENGAACALGPAGPFKGTVTVAYSDGAGRTHTWSAGSESGTFGDNFSEGMETVNLPPSVTLDPNIPVFALDEDGNTVEVVP